MRKENSFFRHAVIKLFFNRKMKGPGLFPKFLFFLGSQLTGKGKKKRIFLLKHEALRVLEKNRGTVLSKTGFFLAKNGPAARKKLERPKGPLTVNSKQFYYSPFYGPKFFSCKDKAPLFPLYRYQVP
jgi:hypothetical protein